LPPSSICRRTIEKSTDAMRVAMIFPWLIFEEWCCEEIE
jgi:hypothetical protein